ncbi:MAG: ubiquinone-binding protein [Gammaproteobacteria bacterium RIFCSPHIGHO2_12_FULL_45_12]|nr:MAG: ubiquinone-binding protein [Gammaproteobacteria bacterium RIFCSPHIGHO2_12_FULL_45_12]
MNKLNRSAIVPYSARQMFELVNSIEDYPRFLPWCSSSQIISRTETEVVATLEIAWKGVHKSFTTKNVLHPYDKMEITLMNGPLHRMEGTWHFQALTPAACKVLLDLEFEFAGSLIDRLFQPVFQYIANTLVEAFCARAVEIYENE